IVLPILYFVPDEGAYTKRYEDTIDALFQIYQSPQLLAFCLLYLFSITFYNYCGLAVTKSLTAVHRTLIDACRTIVCGSFNYLPLATFGEAFNTTYGLIQITRVLLHGKIAQQLCSRWFHVFADRTALYNNLFDLSFLPCFRGQPSDRRTTSASRGQPEAAANGTDDEKAPLLGNEELEPSINSFIPNVLLN
ncbi:putative solute carrier family 35 member F6, partial [Apostichopus japonicus]